MIRYFFNLSGATIRDTDGEECTDLDGAKAVAIRAAFDLARNCRMPEISGLFVCVTDKDGNEVFRAPLAA